MGFHAFFPGFARVALLSRPMFWVWILAGLAVSGFVLLGGLLMSDSRLDADRQADQAATNMADTIEHDIARTFETFDLSLRGVIRSMQEPQIERLTGRARQLALFDYSSNATYMNAMLVLDEKGNIVDDSRRLDSPRVNLADRDYFQVHRGDPNVGMYLSNPFKSRVQDGEWSIAISRRINRPDGSFGGVVVGTMALDYFQSLFANLSLGPGGSVTIFRSNGTLIAHQPFQLNAIGRDFSSSEIFQNYPAQTAGYFESAAAIDGTQRRYAFRQIGNLPLLVSVGLAVSDIYAPWRQKALVIGALISGFALMTVAMAALLSREFARRKRADDLLRESEARYRLLADNSSDAIVLRTPDGNRKYATPAFYQMIGRSPEEMTEAHLFESFAARKRTLRRLRAGDQRVVELLQYGRRDGTYLWLESVSSAVFDAAGTMTEIISNIRDVTSRKAAEDVLAAAATTDGMTGIANRRSFDERLASEWRRALRTRSHIALLMIDVDCFKAYNDTFGHLQGDEALKQVANCIASNLRRPSDLAARYGGEEFAVILPDTDASGAACVAEKIHSAISKLALPHPHNPTGSLTISIGLGSMQPVVGDDVLRFIRTADTALYQAKREGRNQTKEAQPDGLRDLVRLGA